MPIIIVEDTPPDPDPFSLLSSSSIPESDSQGDQSDSPNMPRGSGGGDRHHAPTRTRDKKRTANRMLTATNDHEDDDDDDDDNDRKTRARRSASDDSQRTVEFTASQQRQVWYHYANMLHCCLHIIVMMGTMICRSHSCAMNTRMMMARSTATLTTMITVWVHRHNPIRNGSFLFPSIVAMRAIAVAFELIVCCSIDKCVE
jgi:hypothetical protein